MVVLASRGRWFGMVSLKNLVCMMIIRWAIFGLANGVGVVAVGSRLTLSLGSFSSDNQDQDGTFDVAVDGLEGTSDCNAVNLGDVIIRHRANDVFRYQQDNLVYKVYFSDTNFWAGTETVSDGQSGSAGLWISTYPGSPGVCFIAGRISSATNRNSIIIGTYANGQVWAKTVDSADSTPERDVVYPAHGNTATITGDDSGDVIDLLVPFTREAMCKYAGENFPCDDSPANQNPIRAQVDLLIAETNNVLRNTEISLSVNLVHTFLAQDYQEGAMFAGTEEWFSRALDYLQTAGDGVFENPSVLELRDEFCADIIGLIVSEAEVSGGFSTFGIASGIGPDPSAFTFVSSLDPAALSGFTFAHEWGHIMGCRHDIFADPSPPQYAHGYVDPGLAYSSIMTTRGTCNTNCIRKPVFSALPPFLFEGLIMGGSTADNRRVLEETRIQMANFRDSSVCIEASPPPTPYPAPPPTSPPTPYPVPLSTKSPLPAPTNGKQGMGMGMGMTMSMTMSISMGKVMDMGMGMGQQMGGKHN